MSERNPPPEKKIPGYRSMSWYERERAAERRASEILRTTESLKATAAEKAKAREAAWEEDVKRKARHTPDDKAAAKMRAKGIEVSDEGYRSSDAEDTIEAARKRVSGLELDDTQYESSLSEDDAAAAERGARGIELNPQESTMRRLPMSGGSFEYNKKLGAGYKYKQGEKEWEIELASGERTKRLPGKDGEPAFHREEIRFGKKGGKRTILYPPGFERLDTSREHGASQAFTVVLQMRLLASKLLDMYSPGYKTADGDILPFSPDKHAKKVAEAKNREVRTGIPAKTGIFYADFEDNGDPCFRYEPVLYTSDLVDDTGEPLIVEGWSGHSQLIVQRSEAAKLGWKEGARKLTPRNKKFNNMPMFDYIDNSDEKNPTTYQMIVYEYRGKFKPGVTPEEAEAASIETKKTNAETIMDLEGQGLIDVPQDGDWSLTAKGKRFVDPKSIYVTHPLPIYQTNFHVKTSKMGCASWNMPAGPPKLGDQDLGGSCNAALPINLMERVAEEVEDGHPRIDPRLIKLKSSSEYRAIRETMGERLVEQARNIEKVFTGSVCNTSDYHDTTEKEETIQLKTKTKIEMVKVPGLICSYCYALKSNYAYLNNQFWQAVRYQWARAAVLAPATLFSRPGTAHTNSGVKVRRTTEIGDKPTTFFSAFMVAAIRSYYSVKNEPRRLPFGEDVRFYRVHDSGDFFSLAYINAWLEVAKSLPEIRFWAPTRMWRDPASVAAFQQRSENFSIRPSAIHFEDAAPHIVGCSAGSTGAPDPLVKHWNCPATTHDRSACMGAMTYAKKYNDVTTFKFVKDTHKEETTCRVCWGGFDYMPEKTRQEIDSIPVSYKVH